MIKSGPAVQDEDFSRKWRTLQAVMLGTFIAPLDASIVNTILPFFTSVFHADISLVQWIPTVYLLVISCLILIFGRLGDMVGHKIIYLTGVGLFSVTSLFCGLSQNIWMLITFRGFQGIAGAMLLSVGPAIVTSAFPARERGKALGVFTTSIAIALALGPTLGGMITEYLSWRFVFFINIPIGAFAVMFGLRTIPLGKRNKGQRLDWPGAITLFIFLSSILLYMNKAKDWGWSSAGSVMLLVCASVSGVWFIRTEKKAPQPMVDLDLFKNRVFALGNVSLLLNFIAAYTVVFLTPFYLTLIMKLPISRVGLVMATFPLVMLVVSPLSGTISDHIGYRVLTCSGMLICSFAMVLFSRLTAANRMMDVVWYLLIFSLGTSAFMTPNSSAVMGSIPKKYLGIASGILANMRSLGMILGIAISGAVFYNIAPTALIRSHSILNNDEIQKVLAGFHWAFVTAAVVAFSASITSFFSKNSS
ncbi:multidrug resistance protein stp [bacterium BMS3Abin09]|nr:multidrug resistance protein stp [bacterium BMS3Abin09]